MSQIIFSTIKGNISKDVIMHITAIILDVETLTL